MNVARVLVDVSTRAVDKAFDYSIPDAMQGVVVGCAVAVDFAGRPAVAYVVEIVDIEAERELKPLISVLTASLLPAHAWEMASWMAERYVSSIADALRLFLPPGGSPSAVKTDSGWMFRHPAQGPVDDRWIVAGDALDDFTPRRGATAQSGIVAAVRTGPVRAAELGAVMSGSNAAILKLESLGVVRVESRRRVRGNPSSPPAPESRVTLMDAQRTALETVSEMIRARRGTVLLDGVTGSGKTEIYLRAIQSVLLEGGTAIVLVPEISLTPQTVARFRARLGDTVAVLHSGLSAGERYDQWDRIAGGDARVAIGPRSALFAPMTDLRLIVVDEEHDSSYKNGSPPRYQTRDAAVRLAQVCGAVAIFGTATPSLEARHRVATGEWTHVVLPDRVNARPMPDVSIVDMRREFSEGNRSIFSAELRSALDVVRAERRKAVLLLNRRGFASFLLCRECGHVPECDSCSVSLTYHDDVRTLRCHHCDAVRAVPPTCPECGSPYLRVFGAGTQRVVSDMTEHFPDWPVVRMDADTTRGKGAHERLLREFSLLETGVLVGTQMIAKGHDFPDVDLVGVVNADTTLHLPDFRAQERTFQLLTQVSGRAGRGDRPGACIIQTYVPDDPAIQAAAGGDSSRFFANLMVEREELGYPPAGALANVIVRARESKAAAGHAALLAGVVGDHATAMGLDVRVVGPSPAPIERVKSAYRWHFLAKSSEFPHLAHVLRGALADCRPPSGVTVGVDIDPSDVI